MSDAEALIPPSTVDEVNCSIVTEMLTVDELTDKVQSALGESIALEFLEFAIDKKVPKHKNEIVQFLEKQIDMTSKLCLTKLQEIS